MDHPKLISVCTTMYYAFSEAPYLRIGQLLDNFFSRLSDKGKDPFYMSDDEFANEFEDYVREVVEKSVRGIHI